MTHINLIKKINESHQLSERELQCLLISIRGRSARQAAIELGISQRTVEEYLDNIKKKLGVRSKTDMIDYGVTVLLNML